jgi:hypothetical protein
MTQVQTSTVVQLPPSQNTQTLSLTRAGDSCLEQCVSEALACGITPARHTPLACNLSQVSNLEGSQVTSRQGPAGPTRGAATGGGCGGSSRGPAPPGDEGGGGVTQQRRQHIGLCDNTAHAPSSRERTTSNNQQYAQGQVTWHKQHTARQCSTMLCFWISPSPLAARWCCGCRWVVGLRCGCGCAGCLSCWCCCWC